MTRNGTRRGARLVLGSALALGVAALAYYLLTRPATVGLDYRVYDVAARAVLDGRDLYAVTPADSDFGYLYPPVTVLAFVPFVLAASGWLPGYLALTAASVLASLGAAGLLVGYVESLGHRLDRVDRALVAGFLVVSVHATPSLVFGQVNHLLVAAVTAGLVWVGRGRDRLAGLVLALPAFVKVFPAAAWLWLVGRRDRRALGATLATAAALALASLLTFGVDLHVAYVTDVLLPRREADAFAGGLAPGADVVTLRRPLSVLAPTVDPRWYAVGAAALLGPVLAALYWRPDGPTDWLVALHGTLVAMLLFFPSLLVYYAFLAPSLVPLLYDLPDGRGRRLFVAGALLANGSVALGGFRRFLRALPLAAETAAALAATLRPVFALGTPVLYGCLLMLAGCLLYRIETGAFDALTAAARTAD